MKIVNIFPALLSYAVFAPLILRLALGFFILKFAKNKLDKNQASYVSFFETYGFKPARWYVIAFGALEIIIGIFIIIGLYTQIAALLAVVIFIVSLIVSHKKTLPSATPTAVYALLLIIALFLLINGAGLPALDLPL
ncbi:MAG: DoxX family membrane protein [Candidatus Pacebacteria bacterium]|nr:DoxX family membrane protein [Candidatus Paceibacterota bacterium]